MGKNRPQKLHSPAFPIARAQKIAPRAQKILAREKWIILVKFARKMQESPQALSFYRPEAVAPCRCNRASILPKKFFSNVLSRLIRTNFCSPFVRPFLTKPARGFVCHGNHRILDLGGGWAYGLINTDICNWEPRGPRAFSAWFSTRKKSRSKAKKVSRRLRQAVLDETNMVSSCYCEKWSE